MASPTAPARIAAALAVAVAVAALTPALSGVSAAGGRATQSRVGDAVVQRRILRRALAPSTSRPARTLTARSDRRIGSHLPSATNVFAGMSNETRVAPPDPIGDVSASQYVQSVNGMRGARVAVFDKATGAIEGEPFDLEDLWDRGRCKNHGWGDPVVQFDQLANRWLLSQFAFRFDRKGNPTGPYFECIAVSATDDASGSYFTYPFRITRFKLPDFPKFGVWPDAYYMSIHLLGRKGGTAQGIIAFDRERMLEGAPAREMVFFVNRSLFGLLPSDLEGPTPPPSGTPNYLVVLRDDDLGAREDKVFLYAFSVDWIDPERSAIEGIARLDTDAFDSNLCAGDILCVPQKGTGMKLDASAGVPDIGAYLGYPLVYRNFGDHESLLFQHTVAAGGRDRAGINWFELRNPSTSPVLSQQGTYAPGHLDRWVASIAMDGIGEIALGFSTSSARTYPSIAYTGRSPSDPLGAMPLGDNDVITGAGAQTGSPRWGDYTSLSVDPADDCTFWYTNEYYASTSRSHWRTAIASFRLPGCS
ncbi:MAG: hypothetical protein M3290_03750 [Actinomycetota bacterium]|nr:hypothetical protein [Actinomycetota bacterium]